MPSANDVALNAPGYFNRKHVSGEDGGLVLTIKTVAYEEIGSSKEEKQVVGFVEKPKKLVLNGVRRNQLIDLFGDDELVGKKVRLYVDTVNVNNQPMEMICVGPAD
jgi:hypothetical protein